MDAILRRLLAPERGDIVFAGWRRNHGGIGADVKAMPAGISEAPSASIGRSSHLRRTRRQWARRAASGARPLLRRTTPLSSNWGYERGTPIDRVYIEEFIADHRVDIRGRVLEVGDSGYTDRFGSGVTSRDVLDIDRANPSATIIADLADAGSIPAETFDCFILTQTLQYVREPGAAVAHAYRILRRGGVLLATMPSIIRVDAQSPDVDRWRFTEVSCRELFGERFGADQVDVSTAGNVPAAMAFLTGMAAEEFGSARLAERDPSFPVLICARAAKTSNPSESDPLRTGDSLAGQRSQ